MQSSCDGGQTPRSYDLGTPDGLADYLEDANVLLVRSEYLKRWFAEGKTLPRRQDAEQESLDEFPGEFPKCFVPHEEMRRRIQQLANDMNGMTEGASELQKSFFCQHAASCVSLLGSKVAPRSWQSSAAPPGRERWWSARATLNK
jgi:hypothetical protein